MSTRERIERERATHYAALHERKRTRGTHQDRKRNDARRSRKSKPREPEQDPRTYRARTQDDLREDVSHLYAELHAATDPDRREEIELEIFRLENGVR